MRYIPSFIGMCACVVLTAAASDQRAAVSSLKRIRDPFSLPQNKKEWNKQQVHVEGIVHMGQRCCAVLARGDNHAIVEPGATFEGYVLVSISKCGVVLGRGGKTKSLSLE